MTAPPEIPSFVQALLYRLESKGYQAYIVGGCVRDLLLHRTPSDWDVTTDAYPDQVIALFPRSEPTGIRHGTVTVITEGGNVEVTTFRSDGDYSDARHPDKVSFSLELREDLKRRDFTVNAMAADRYGHITDLFGGTRDLAKKRIVCVGNATDRLREDALRMLRAYRFAAVLEFQVDPGIEIAVSRLYSLCAQLSAERIRDEIQKILLSPKPEILRNICRLGLLDRFFQNSKPEVYGLDKLSHLPLEPAPRWAGLTGLLLKQKAISDASIFLRAMRLPRKLAADCAAGVKICLDSHMPTIPVEWKKLIALSGQSVAVCAAAAWDCLSEAGGSGEILRSVLSSGECCTMEQLALRGADLLALGYLPGPALGQVLSVLLMHVIKHPEANDKEILLQIAKEIK